MLNLERLSSNSASTKTLYLTYGSIKDAWEKKKKKRKKGKQMATKVLGFESVNIGKEI